VLAVVTCDEFRENSVYVANKMEVKVPLQRCNCERNAGYRWTYEQTHFHRKDNNKN
jgi:hypothetical protein